MICGAYWDIKERRYPKPFFFSSVISGLCFAYLNGFFIQSLIAFIAFTIIGIWASDKKIMANGDLWCFSSLFLYIDICDVKSGVLLVISLLVWTFLIGTFHKRNILTDLRNGLTQLKALIGYKIYFTIDVQKARKKESIPVTVILVGALTSTLFIEGVMV